MKNLIRQYGIYILIFILITAVFFYYGHCKAGYFIDEIYTYGLSNSHFAPYLKDVAGGGFQDKIITNEDLLSYVTVDDGEELDLASVYYNQEADVHPPLYYWIFNAVSSIVPDVFSKWTGLILEYIIFIGTLLLLLKLCNELFHSDFSSCCALLLYGLSYAGISTAVYIRMYCLLTFLTLLLAYYIIRLIHTGNIKYCILSSAAIMLGMLTQYYFVFYAFFVCLSACIYLLIKKEIKLFFAFGISSLIGVALMVIIFPACIKHIFIGNGQVVSGGVAVENLLNISAWTERLFAYAHFVSHGIKAAVIIGIVAVVYLIVKKRFTYMSEIMVVGVSAVFTWFMIAVIAAVQEERYIYNIMPIFVIVCVYLLDQIQFKNGRLPLLCITVLCMVTTGCNSDYIQAKSLDNAVILDEFQDCPCVYMTDNKFAAMTSDYYELLTFDDFFTTNSTDSEKLEEYVNDADEIVVFIDCNEEWSSGLDPETELDGLKNSLGYATYEKLIDNTLSVVYVMR